MTADDEQIDMVTHAIHLERRAQHKRWGQQDHADGYWLGIVTEELGEAARAYIEGRPDAELIGELVQTAATLASWIDCVNRRGMQHPIPEGATG